MPQASQTIADKITARFGSLMDDGPTKFLEAAGYTLRRDFLWTPKAGVTCLKDMTEDEFVCIAFLVQEWDYGPLEPTPAAAA